MQGFRFHSGLVGRSDPWSKKWWVIFLKWWAQAYQTNHSWHFGSILSLHSLTQTLVCISILTADSELSHPFLGIGKISVLTKIGKFDIVLMYDVSIARLIPIIKLTLVYYEERERKKQVLLYSIILWNCKYVTICSVFILYETKMVNQIWNFFVRNWEKHTF